MKSQIDRAIQDFSERGKHERLDDTAKDRVTILADYFGVPEEYFWDPDVVEECDRDIIDHHTMKMVLKHYLNGFRRTDARLPPPSPMPRQWWTENGTETLTQNLRDPELRTQIMEWFRDELEIITAVDNAMTRVEARKADPDS